MKQERDSKNLTFRESRARSLVKALGYRILSIAGTSTLIWFITKNVRKTISITVVLQIFLIILYYSYERVWNRIQWGRR